MDRTEQHLLYTPARGPREIACGAKFRFRTPPRAFKLRLNDPSVCMRARDYPPTVVLKCVA
jgi:hypothetical protein